MAIDRMACRREWANQVLVFHLPLRYHTQRVGENSQASLDHRARLRRAQAGTGTGTLRRSRLARISSSCHLMHRCLRLPGGGTKSFFPLFTHPPTGAMRPAISARVQAPRLAVRAPNVIIPTPSQPCESRSPDTFYRNSL